MDDPVSNVRIVRIGASAGGIDFFDEAPMRILIEISPEHYDGFVAKCDIASREYSILRNCRVVPDQTISKERMIAILCERVEAARLLYAASLFYPEAVLAIKAGLDRARES